MAIDKNILSEKKNMDAFPKIELHRHLEGCFDVPTLFEIANKNQIDAPKEFEAFRQSVQFPKNHPPDFKVFLSKFRNDWYRDFDDINNLIYKSVLNFAQESMHYIELRFSPEHFAFFNDFDRIEVAKAIIESANKAAAEGNFTIIYLITFNRNKQTAEEMLSLYKKIASAGLTDVIGYDLAGDELLNPAEEFTLLFDTVKDDGYAGITIHAGEVTPPEQIWTAIEKLHAQRIGHGTTSIKDEKLQKYLKDNNIYLEQCPVSNYFTGAWVDTPLHPFKRLNDAGVLVTLNSDDPTVQNTTLTDDFIAAVRFYGQDAEGLTKLNIRSIEGSFLKEAEKKALISSYKKRVDEVVSKIKSS